MNEAVLVLGVMIRFSSYICSDVVELSDECMLNDVNSNFRGEDHKDIREQHPQVV